jgi:RNA polymerase sigma factor (sigma-70 family)
VPNHLISHVVRHLRRATLLRQAVDVADGSLLGRFVEHQDGDAFAVLVRRHGPMVWGVCRRTLAGYHDAEDAFQATFLVLARRAASVIPREMVGNWLYGVAWQTARKARATAERNAARFVPVANVPERLHDSGRPDDLRWVLDRELARLPDKYRAVIVLCDLEGKTRDQSARELGCPAGTVASRLATARSLLAKRLGRNGVPLTAGALAAAFVQEAAAVPVAVSASAIEAGYLIAIGHGAVQATLTTQAAALADEVLKTMMLTNRKTIAAVVAAIAVLGVGTVGLTQTPVPRPDGGAKAEQPRPKPLVSPWSKRLASGITVDLVGVSPSPPAPGSWRLPDGSPLIEVPYDRQPGRVQPGPDQQAREFAIRLRGLPAGPATVRWDIRPAGATAVGMPEKNGRPVSDVMAAAVAMPAGRAVCTVRFGLAAGPWTTEASGQGGLAQGGEKVSVVFGTARPFNGGAAITVSTNLIEPDLRLVAVDADGNEQMPTGSHSGGAGNVLSQIDAEFSLPPERVKEFRLQSRPFEWAEFANVWLSPAPP